MIYVTNTTCTVELLEVALTLANEVFLKVAGNTSSRGWGTQGVIKVTLDEGSKWVLTADSYISELTGDLSCKDFYFYE